MYAYSSIQYQPGLQESKPCCQMQDWDACKMLEVTYDEEKCAKVVMGLRDFIYRAEIMSRMACGNDNWTGYKEVTGQTLDISEWLDFEFYDLVWWINHPMKPIVMDPQ